MGNTKTVKNSQVEIHVNIKKRKINKIYENEFKSEKGQRKTQKQGVLNSGKKISDSSLGNQPQKNLSGLCITHSFIEDALNESFHAPRSHEFCSLCNGGCLLVQPTILAYSRFILKERIDSIYYNCITSDKLFDFSTATKKFSDHSKNQVMVIDVPGDGNC